MSSSVDDKSDFANKGTYLFSKYSKSGVSSESCAPVVFVVQVEEKSVLQEARVLLSNFTDKDPPVEEGKKGPVDRIAESSLFAACVGRRTFSDMNVEQVDWPRPQEVATGDSEDASLNTAEKGCKLESESETTAGFKTTSREPRFLDSKGKVVAGSDKDSLLKRGGKGSVPDQVPFSSGIPTVGKIKGLLHLYKENNAASVAKCPTDKICIYGIPSSVLCHDLVEFLAPASDAISCLQVVRMKDRTMDHYMALLRMKDASSAVDFHSTFSGKSFNSFEDHVCQVFFVRRVEIRHKTDGASLPVAGLTELPNCPVCLERMEEPLSGILTILCNHSFHIECLTKWTDNTCPICRYYQTPNMSDSSSCSECHCCEDLWMCLICGYVGCGRYHGGHARIHFENTQHTYSMKIGSRRVWDYIGDNYVHRLVQNKGDGKLVEVEGQDSHDGVEKMDALQLEYTYLLTSQLESQRVYFEEKLAIIEQVSNQQIESVEARCKASASEREQLEAKVSEMVKDKKGLDKKCSSLLHRLDRQSELLGEEKELNKALHMDQSKWKGQVSSLEEKLTVVITKNEKEISSLQEQVRDLMFYLDTQKQVTGSPSKQDIQDGHVIVTQTPTPKKPKKKHK